MMSKEKLKKYSDCNMQVVFDSNGVRDELVKEIKQLRRRLARINNRALNALDGKCGAQVLRTHLAVIADEAELI